MDNFDSFIDSLIDNDPLAHGRVLDDQNPGLPKNIAKAEAAVRPADAHDCVPCNGTGLWRMRNSYGNNRCHTCNGRGWTVASPEQLRRNRIKAAEKKVAAKADAREANIAALGEANFKRIEAASMWSEFARSLIDQHNVGKAWSEKQIASLVRMSDKLEAKDAERAEQRKADEVTVDLSAVRAMFETAYGNGYKRPVYRAEGLVISRAPSHGRNPGALYVKDASDTYLGKIVGTVYTPSRDAKDTAAALAVIAQDPLAAAVAYGRRTGQCACCGRTLTNHESIERGIGPICAERWGF